MELTIEIWNKVLDSEATKSEWRNTFDSTEYINASFVNEKLTGLPLNRQIGCHCIEDLFFLMKRRNFEQIKYNMDKLFKLKEGEVIMSMHLATPLTSASTDEDAIRLLKASPNAIVNFTSYPSDWEKVVKEYKFKDESEASEFDSLSYEDLKALAKEKGYEGAQKKAEILTFLKSL